MKRLYYLTDSLDSAEQIAKDIHQAGITDWNFHVLCKDEAGLYRRHIHSANYFQKLEIVRYGERGLMLGALVGLLALWYVNAAQPWGENLGGLAKFAVFGFVALFGGWLGGMVGLTKENQKIARYHHDIEAGRYLILIDVKRGQEERIREMMARGHSEAQFKRIGDTFINPFKLAGA